MFDFKTGVASTSSTKSRRVEQLESRGERGKEIGSVELPSSPIAISCVWGRAAITNLDGDLLTQIPGGDTFVGLTFCPEVIVLDDGGPAFGYASSPGLELTFCAGS